MRRVLIIGLLFLLMYVLQFQEVKVDTPFNPKSLAAFGFVLLAAYTFGEITSAFGLPKITGYIATGVLFGPHVINLFSDAVVKDIDLINELAIGLIALTAGAEMKVSGLKAVAKSLTFIVLIKGLLILIAIVGAVFAARSLVPFLAAESVSLVLSVGMIFGVLAIGTSPAATIAVINETESRGRLSDITLGAAVAKDVVMVVLLAIAISLTKLFSTAGAVFDPAILITVGEELLLSIVAGALLGGIIILYIRFVHAEMWLFIVGLIFFATFAAQEFHLEALLMFIAAGFVAQNLSKYGDEFIHPVEHVSLPVYVVFFSIAGAGLNLLAVRQVWKIAMILVVVRIVAIYLGTKLSVVLAKEQPKIKKNAWLSFISQAGVVLGLSIIVENNLPELGPQIKLIVLATIGFNLLLGPVALKVALSRAGETKEQRDKNAAATESEEVAEPDEPVSKSQPSLPDEIRFPSPQFASAELNRAASKLREDLLMMQKDFEESTIEPQMARLQTLIARMEDRYLEAIERLSADIDSTIDPQDLIDIFRESRTDYSRWLLREITGLMAQEETDISKEAFQRLFSEIDRLCETVEGNISVVQEPERFLAAPDDTFYVRMRKRLKRVLRFLRRMFGSGAKMKRSIDFRRLARYHFAGALPPHMLRVGNFVGAESLFALKKSEVLYAQIDENYEAAISLLERTKEDSIREVDGEEMLGKMRADLLEDFKSARADMDHYNRDIKRQMTFVLSQAYGEFLSNLEIAGTFELPPRRFRYSIVYEKREKAKKEIARAFDTWEKYHKGFIGAYGKHIEVVILMDNVARAVNETVFSVLESIDDKLLVGINGTRQRCEQSRQSLTEAFDSKGTVADLKEGLSRQKDDIAGFIQTNMLKNLSDLRESRELSAFVDIMLQRFSTLADEMPARYRVLDEKDIITEAGDGLTPPDIELKTIPLQEVTRSYLETEIARDLANVNRIMFEQVDETVQAVAEVHQIVSYNLKACLEELERLAQTEYDPQEVARLRELAVGGLERATAKLETTTEKVLRLKEQVYEQIIAQVDNRMRNLETLILKRSSFDIKVHLKQRQALARSYLYVGQLWRWLVETYRRLILRYRPLSQVVVKDLKLSLGLQQFTPSEILEIYDQAVLDQAVIQKLPFIYQRLFDIAPLEAGDFLVARDQEMQIVETAKLRWQQGMHCGIAVIGELGSGKTSFINAMLKQVFDEYPAHKILFTRTTISEAELVGELSDHLGLPGARTFEDIQSQMSRRAQKSVIVLEDAHNLYLRTLGGFEALRRLLLLIANTSNQVLWVISIRKYAWLYLDEVLNISDYFTFAINTENLSPRQQEQLILSRHKVSGFDLKFLPDAIMEQRKKYRRASDEEKQEMLKKEFFEDLNKASEGNALAAIFYWLKSIASVEENALVINPLQPLRFDFLWDMQIEKLLTLSMIIQHGTLAAEEHAQIFGIDVRSSLSTLTYLANINLLTKELGEDGEYQFAVNRVIYIPLSKELRTRNIVH